MPPVITMPPDPCHHNALNTVIPNTVTDTVSIYGRETTPNSGPDTVRNLGFGTTPNSGTDAVPN